MKRIIPLLLCALTATATATPYADANAAAARGDHQAAITSFKASIEHSGWSANALLGLANAYAATGDLGHAVLALERAHVLAPDDAAVTAALASTRERAAVDPPRTSRVDAVLGTWSADTWTWLSLGGLALACAGVAALAWSRRRAAAPFALLGLAVNVGCGLAALHVMPDPRLAIVVEGQPAKIAPVAAAETAFSARPGERVRIEQRRGDFVYVRMDSEHSGWLPTSAVKTVITPDRNSAST